MSYSSAIDNALRAEYRSPLAAELGYSSPLSPRRISPITGNLIPAPYSSYDAIVAAENADAVASRLALQAKQSELRRMQSELTVAKHSLDESRDALATKEHELQLDLDEVQKARRRDQATMEAEMVRVMATKDREANAMIGAYEQENQARLDLLSSQHRETMTAKEVEHQVTTEKALNEQKLALEHSHDSIMRQTESEHKKEMLQYGTDLKARHASEVSTLEASYHRQIQELSDQHQRKLEAEMEMKRRELAEVEREWALKLESAVAKTKREAEEFHVREMNALRALHEDAQLQLKDKHRTDLARKEEDLQQACAHLQEELDRKYLHEMKLKEAHHQEHAASLEDRHHREMSSIYKTFKAELLALRSRSLLDVGAPVGGLSLLDDEDATSYLERWRRHHNLHDPTSPLSSLAKMRLREELLHESGVSAAARASLLRTPRSPLLSARATSPLRSRLSPPSYLTRSALDTEATLTRLRAAEIRARERQDASLAESERRSAEVEDILYRARREELLRSASPEDATRARLRAEDALLKARKEELAARSAIKRGSDETPVHTDNQVD